MSADLRYGDLKTLNKKMQQKTLAQQLACVIHGYLHNPDITLDLSFREVYDVAGSLSPANEERDVWR